MESIINTLASTACKRDPNQMSIPMRVLSKQVEEKLKSGGIMAYLQNMWRLNRWIWKTMTGGKLFYQFHLQGCPYVSSMLKFKCSRRFFTYISLTI
jgi:hypothetical protein